MQITHVLITLCTISIVLGQQGQGVPEPAALNKQKALQVKRTPAPAAPPLAGDGSKTSPSSQAHALVARDV
jgi:hypothetical protein